MIIVMRRKGHTAESAGEHEAMLSKPMLAMLTCSIGAALVFVLMTWADDLIQQRVLLWAEREAIP